MATLTEGRHTAEFILTEASGLRSRDQIKVASGSGKLSPSQLLGKITASGKFAPHDPTASDGSEVAVAVLYSAVDASTADAEGVAVVRDCEVKGAELVYHADIDTEAEKLAVHASLAANGIIVR